MNSRSWALSFFVALLVALSATACAHGKTAAAPGRATAEEAARRERERPRIEAPREPPPLKVVQSKGTCAPAADNLVTLGSCCNDKPCRGQCVEGEAGKVECSCFGIRGGCPDGQVCCRFRHQCVPAKECELP